MNYKIATIEDLDILVKIRIEVLRAANKLDDKEDMSIVYKESYMYYKESLMDNSHIAILVYDGDKLVGTGGVSFYKVMPTYNNPKGKKAYIMNMYTKPDYRRKKIAYHTLEILVRRIKNLGIKHITLEATDMGRPLYEKFGFVNMNDEMQLKAD